MTTIILNDQLSVVTSKPCDLSQKLQSIAFKRHPLDRGYSYDILDENSPQTQLRNTGFIGLVSHCYSNHLPLSLAPHDVWVLLLSQVSNEISENSQDYREFFTVSDKKEKITVPSGSLTHMPMDILSSALAGKVLFDSSIIFPQFSEKNVLVTETLQAIFCDMASPYYDYAMFLCGIPKIEVRGSVEDWQKLLSHFEQLVNTFNTDNLKMYLSRITPILEQFILAVQNTIDNQFWQDIFTQKNVGSGGDLIINGWVTKLFMTEHSFPKINNFTTSHGAVKYEQINTREEFVALYGGFDTLINENGFWQLEYKKFILQKVKVF